MVDVYKELCTQWWVGICTNRLYEIVDGHGYKEEVRDGRWVYVYKEVVRDGGIYVNCVAI